MTHRVGVLVFDRVTLLDVTGPVEVLHTAGVDRRYESVLISARGGLITTAANIALATTAVADVDTIDTLIVPGSGSLAYEPIDDEILRTTSLLADVANRVAAVCTGAFVLAELGLLDDRRATTHWRQAPILARRYPRIEVVPDALHIRDGRYLTSAGVSAGIDMALALVEHDHGPEVARAIARELVVFMQRPGGQSQFSAALDTPRPRTATLRAALDAVLADPAAAHSLDTLAAVAALSTRQLTRLFHAELGTTPARWIERTRLDRAQQLLLEGHTITAAARRSGLGSDETLRRAFARHLGITPTEFKRRFATTCAEAR
ncbi:GlxA family transcriptional regulator [Nocardia brasiliensis]|uniref:GlxA family transcriptional regulator n=1 Tax=Nocardia brasiliensis TaxID=37326 RepID=UPI00245561CA|nr:helix-turn-helix domain-containing protein [Nocardia brasiliensis]